MGEYNKILKVSTGCFLFTAIFFILGYHQIFKLVVRDQMALRKRNMIRKFYLDLPVPLHFCVNFFNVSNPSEVMTGIIPVLKEIGPYCYDLHEEKIDTVDNPSEDSLLYTRRETFFYNQHKSGNFKESDYVTILHPLIVGVVNVIGDISPALYKIVNGIISPLFNNPDSIYTTAKVRDILFDGLLINCSTKTTAMKVACMQVRSKLPGVKEVDNGIFKFGIIGSRNGTNGERIKVLRGIRSASDIGRVIEINGQKSLKLWGGEECNGFRGTDGWIVPPFIDKDKGIWVQSSDLCRKVHLTYIEDVKIHGIKLQKYYSDLGNMQVNPDEKCFCPTPKTCLPKGVLNVKKCLGAPIYLTLPHFLRADEKFLKQVKGLAPVTDDHIIKLVLEQRLAVPFEVHIRAQANLQIGPNPQIDLLKNVPFALHPIFWFEIGFVMDGHFLKLSKAAYMGLDAFDVIRYFFLIGSVGGMAYGAFLHYKAKKVGRIEPISDLLRKKIKFISFDENKTDNNVQKDTGEADGQLEHLD